MSKDNKMHKNEPIASLLKDEVLRVGMVSEVNGRIVTIKVDENKNLSDIFFDGEILRNVAVDSYIEIRKGFLSIIGKVDGERIQEEPIGFETTGYDKVDKNRRYLTVSLIGYIGLDQKFVAGMKELPLISNEAYVVTKDQINKIYNLVSKDRFSINIAKTVEDFDIEFPVDTLFGGHIAIFGNTGSGKSNTLTSLYSAFIEALNSRNKDAYKANTSFILFDFNGEYKSHDCITTDKTVYNLSTHDNHSGKIPFAEEYIFDLEVISILADATEKTQKPFLKRALNLYKRVNKETKKEDRNIYFRNILKTKVKETLSMSDKISADLLIDYIDEILPTTNDKGLDVNIKEDLVWHNKDEEFRLYKNNQVYYLKQHPDEIEKTVMYTHVDCFQFSEDISDNFINFLYLQLILDILSNRAKNEHVSPVIGRLNSRKNDIMKIFDTAADTSIWKNSNFIVINLNDVNLEMKKFLPLLLCKKIYSDHKRKTGKTLNIIIDEAHNILSTESSRESETWKDYRLETFEEIIKEGRKFGVFVTISSQRPSDISPTITSQAHNYFIHRLINRHDLAMISSAVSYIDKLTEDSIPTLPTGTCIFSGIASQRPIKVQIKELHNNTKPNSHTLKFSNIVPSLDDIMDSDLS